MILTRRAGFCLLVLVVLSGCGRATTSPRIMRVTPAPDLHPDRIDPRPDRLTVMSYNLKHRDRPDQLAIIAEQLRQEQGGVPDFILCQEVVFGRRRGPENTAAVLADEMNFHVKATKRRSDREGLAIVSRYPFAYYAERHLDSRTNSLLLGFRRVSVMGEFLLPEVGRVRVVNVHFAHWGFESHVRRQQLRETLQWMALREGEVHADVLLLGGDFNADPGKGPMTLIPAAATVNGIDFRDFNSNEPTKGPEGRPNRRIDYIFVASADRDVRMITEKLLFQEGLPSSERSSRRFFPSDHLPVVHEYEVGGPVMTTQVQFNDSVD